MISKIIRFITTDVWRIRLSDLTPGKSFLVRQLRVVLLAGRGFDEDKCQLRASALTFYTLISIVPVVAMVFGIAKGFGFEKLLERELLNQFAGQEEVLGGIINYARSLLQHTRGGVIAGVGLAALFWAVIKVLWNIERSFNDIWGVTEQRTFGKKFADYLSVMLICPFFFLLSSSVSVFITTQITLITERIALIGKFGFLIFFMVKLLPLCVVWALFTFIYMFMPNTKVQFRSGLLAGVVAGTIYQIAQWGYITFQVGVAKYNAIYGSFAALPLFLIWLQISWLIVLFGAEISFAHENVETYEFEPDSLKISSSFKKLLSLEIAHLLVDNFSKGKKPFIATEVSHALEIPIRLVRQILHELVKGRILSETNTEDHTEIAYQPAVDTSLLTIEYVIGALERTGIDDIPVAQTKELKTLSESLQTFRGTIEKSPANKLLKDI